MDILQSLEILSGEKLYGPHEITQAKHIVQKLLKTLNDDDEAQKCGISIIHNCGFPVKENSRVQFSCGDKNPRGVTRLLFGLIENYAIKECS